MIAEYLWFFAVGIAPFLVLAVIGYGLLRRRRLTPSERRHRDEATHELYDHQDSATDRR